MLLILKLYNTGGAADTAMCVASEQDKSDNENDLDFGDDMDESDDGDYCKYFLLLLQPATHCQLKKLAAGSWSNKCAYIHLAPGNQAALKIFECNIARYIRR